MRKKLFSAFAGAALVLSLTAGCQATAPDITADQAKAFQARVLAVTSAVAEGGYAAALEALTALETDLDAAAAAGDISFARHQRIEAAITVVRTDVQGAIDAQAEPEPAPAPAPTRTSAPVEEEAEEEATPAPETDAEKKAREAAEKAAEEIRKAAEEAQKEADEKAAEEVRKAAEEARKAAEEDAKNSDGNNGNTGKGQDDGAED